MILEFIMNRIISYEIAKIMTIRYGINYHDLRMDNIYIINKQNRFNNNTTQSLNQEKIIQKLSFKPQLQTITTANNPRNKTPRKQR